MQAVLSGPIVTDYVPAVKPPWAVLVVAVCLLAMVLPREVLSEFCLASALVAAGGWGVNRWCWRGRTRPEPHSVPTDPAG